MYIHFVSLPPATLKKLHAALLFEMEKDKNILVRVSESDQILIKERAAAVNETLSAYARRMLLDGQVITIDPADRRVIAGLANNLNQITRQANSSAVLPADVVNTLQELITELRHAYRKR